LFTSRSEFRLLLRQDNALRRLLPLAERLGLLTDNERRAGEERLRREQDAMDLALATPMPPSAANPVLEACGSSPIEGLWLVADLARRPEVPISELLSAMGLAMCAAETEWADIEFKYEGYLARERSAAMRIAAMEEFELPAGLAYERLHALSTEARQKLAVTQPRSLGQAGRIPGVSPSDLQGLVAAVLQYRRRAVSRETNLSADLEI
jgi:tRNA uridine 5-carboxymethylaminomethyl modification enzyme